MSRSSWWFVLCLVATCCSAATVLPAADPASKVAPKPPVAAKPPQVAKPQPAPAVGNPAAKADPPAKPAQPATENAATDKHASATAAAPEYKIDPLDWAYWRGPEMNGVSRETGLINSWSPEGENVLWESEGLGTRSTPIIMRGNLYTLCRHNPHTPEEAEKVVCADAATGEVKWEHVFNVYLSDVPDTRVGWSSVVGDPVTGRVYALGVCGYFVCLDGDSGQPIWSRSMSEEFGLLTTYGGRTNLPIVFEDLVVISGVTIGWAETSRPAHRFLALNKATGEIVWYQTTKPFPEDTTYGSAVFGVINGEQQLVVGAGDGAVYAFQPRTGAIAWNFPVSPRGLNTAPVILGNTVICGHSEENLDDIKMGALFAIDATGATPKAGPKPLWKNKEQYIGKSSPVVMNDRVYAVDDGGALYICDFKTGKLLGKTKLGTMGRGSPLFADGKIYVTDATGKWFIFEPAEKGVKKIHQLRLDVEINGSPVVSHGRIYLPTETMMYCLGTTDQQVAADPQPELPKEADVAQDQAPAQLVITPYETALMPGRQQPLSARLFNAHGQFLKDVDPKDIEYTVTGLGKVENGVFTAADKPVHGAAMIAAKVGTVTGKARVRIVPPLPWNVTFDKGVIPVDFIGMRYRHVGLDFDLYQALKKENVLASRCYIYLMSQFINTEKPDAKFDDTTPAQAWTGFRRYLDLIEQTNTQDDAKRLLEPVFEILKREQVLASYEWTGSDKIGAQLTVQRGPREITGEGVMCKISTVPKGTRSQGWMGTPDMQNYVVQADVFCLGMPVANGVDPYAKFPDAAVIDQRYRFEMMGAKQQLKLYSWISHDQKYKDVPFEWKTDAWYTLKMKVTIADQDGKSIATVQGKAWPREQTEPADWLIEFTDEPANLTGSPGLAGNAKDAEVFFDNVKVTPLGDAATASRDTR